MADKLTLRNTGTWAIICFGTSCIGFWLARLLMTLYAARGGGVGIDAVAESTALSMKGVAAGIIILAIGVAARLILKPRQQPAQ